MRFRSYLKIKSPIHLLEVTGGATLSSTVLWIAQGRLARHLESTWRLRRGDEVEACRYAKTAR